jgi:polypeptide N-acetylgalactosaminyltransferase
MAAKIVERSFFDGSLRNPDNIKINWHNYAFMEYESKRVGLGEQGKDAIVVYEDPKLKAQLYKANGYNGYLSDMISVNRILLDIRPTG